MVYGIWKALAPPCPCGRSHLKAVRPPISPLPLAGPRRRWMPWRKRAPRGFSATQYPTLSTNWRARPGERRLWPLPLFQFGALLIVPFSATARRTLITIVCSRDWHSGSGSCAWIAAWLCGRRRQRSPSKTPDEAGTVAFRQQICTGSDGSACRVTNVLQFVEGCNRH
jgi:hypothetical protein